MLHTQQIPHGLCRFSLCRCGHMSVSIQGEACGEVAENAADGLDVDAVLEGEGCKGVAEVVESDLWDACPCQNTLQHIVDTVRGNGAAVGGREHVLILGFGFLLPQYFYRLGRDAYGAVGVLCFQRCFHDLTVARLS